MQKIWNQIQYTLHNLDITIGNIYLSKVIAVSVILVLALTLKSFFTKQIIGIIESFTAETETTLDDELIANIKKPLSWLILLTGIWLSQLILASVLSPQLNEIVSKLIGLFFVFICGYIIYRSASLLGYLLGLAAAKTNTELDDLLIPYIPLLIEVGVGVIIVLKTSEVLLGASAGALVGLLGGAGVALGLLFKDIIYDWCCTVIIYTDRLYRSGDLVEISGLSGFIRIEGIGIRTTKLWLTSSGTILKLPNSKMITGIVENWSQNRGNGTEWGIQTTLKIDRISAQQVGKICDAIQELILSKDYLSKDFMRVRFIGLEGNARVIKIIAYVTDESYYYLGERELNLGILKILEQERIDSLHVYLVTNPENNQEIMNPVSNLNPVIGEN